MEETVATRSKENLVAIKFTTSGRFKLKMSKCALVVFSTATAIALTILVPTLLLYHKTDNGSYGQKDGTSTATPLYTEKDTEPGTGTAPMSSTTGKTSGSIIEYGTTSHIEFSTQERTTIALEHGSPEKNTVSANTVKFSEDVTTSQTEGPTQEITTTITMPSPTAAQITTEGPERSTSKLESRTWNEVHPETWPWPCGQRTLKKRRIINGATTALGDVPWQVHIRKASRSTDSSGKEWVLWTSHCGGTLIGNKTVLTAAHCFHDLRVDNYEIILGDLDSLIKEENEQRLMIEQIVPHPSYKSGIWQNDVAILKLESEVKFKDYIQPACLPNPSSSSPYTTPGATDLLISGWGREASGSSARKLQSSRVRVMADPECKEKFLEVGEERGNNINNTMICTFTEGTGSCTGDSGGPAVVEDRSRFISIGIISWGRDCLSATLPNVFQHVPFFLAWIVENA